MATEAWSRNWATPESLDAGTNKAHERILGVLNGANFGYLEEAALLSRKSLDGSLASHITCIIDRARFTFGMNNVVFNVAFSDDVHWIARVHHAPISLSHAREHTMEMLSEVATLKTLGSRTTIPIPQVFGFDASISNTFGFPYMFMERLEGQIPSSTIASRVPAEHLSKVVKQVANVLFQLENLAFDRLGRIWCGENCDEPPRIIPSEGEDVTTARTQTSLECFYTYRQNENKLALETHADDPEWRTACWLLKNAISHIVAEDRIHGPFPLCHFDLHYGNLLFDDEYNLTGVLDWSQSATAPLERLAVSPEFITFPAIAAEKNQIIIDFRHAVRDCLQGLEDEREQAAQQQQLSSNNVNQKPATTTTTTTTTMLFKILGSERAEIFHRCTYSRPYRALFDGRLVAKLIYKDKISWAQLVAAHGDVQVY